MADITCVVNYWLEENRELIQVLHEAIDIDFLNTIYNYSYHFHRITIQIILVYFSIDVASPSIII